MGTIAYKPQGKTRSNIAVGQFGFEAAASQIFRIGC